MTEYDTRNYSYCASTMDIVKFIMQKIAGLFSLKIPSWVSCQKIVFNLHKSYNQNDDCELFNFNFAMESTAEDNLRTVNDIISLNPDVIIFMDHRPHCVKNLSQLLKVLKIKPKIIFMSLVIHPSLFSLEEN